MTQQPTEHPRQASPAGTAAPRKLRIAMPNPSFDRTGELRSVVQLWEHGGEGQTDKLLWRADVRLQDSEAVGEAATECTERGFVGAEAELVKLTAEAHARAKNGDGAVNPYRHPRFYGWAKNLIEELDHDARWVSAREGAFWMNGTNSRPFAVDSPEMAVLLYERFGVSRKDDFYAYLVDICKSHTALRGEKVTLRELAHYDRQANRLVLDMADGNVLVLDGGEPKLERNGAHGVLFSQRAHHQPWKYVRDHGYPLDALIKSFSFVSGEHSPLTVEEQRTMFLFWLVSLFFRSEQAVKPIAVAVGDTGSGKSSMFRISGKLLYGPDWGLKLTDEEKREDFFTSVTNNLLVVYDQHDGRVRWFEDALCAAADGVLTAKRALYTTNTEVAFKPDCFLGVTSRTPKFRRRDVAGRALIWHMAPREEHGSEKKTDRDVDAEIAKDRDRLLSELADMCNQTLRVPVQRGSDSPIRSADHWAVVKRVAMSLKMLDQARTLYGKLREVQKEFATSENPVVLAVQEWLGGKGPDGQPNAGRQLTAAQLHKELAADEDYRKACPNAKALGMTLRELDHDGGLAPYFQVEKSRKGGHGPGNGETGTFYVITPPGAQQEGRLV